MWAARASWIPIPPDPELQLRSKRKDRMEDGRRREEVSHVSSMTCTSNVSVRLTTDVAPAGE